MRPSSRIQKSLEWLTRTPLILWVSLYCAVLLCTYQNLVVPYLRQEGFFSYDYSPTSWILRAILVIAPLGLLARTNQKVSSAILWVLYIVVYLPCQLFIGHMTEFSDGSPELCRVVLFVSFFLMLAIVAQNPVRRSPRSTRSAMFVTTLSPRHFWSTLFVLATVFYAGIIASHGLKFRLLSLEDIYVVRGEFSKASGALGGLAVYFVVWTYKALNPLLLYIGLSSRRYYLIAVALVGQLLVFSVTGFKESIGLLFLTTGLWAVQRTQLRQNIGKSLLIGTTLLFAAIYIVDSISGSSLPILTIVLIRRVVFVPAKLTAYYFDFFSGHDVYYLSHSLFKWFLSRPYELAPAFLIGQQYALSSELSFNANYLADGVANFGWPGSLVFSIALGFVLRFCDSNFPAKVQAPALALVTIPAFSLTNSGLLTSLLTHGVGLTIILLMILPPEVLEPRARNTTKSARSNRH